MKISVITTVYNGEQFLKEAIDSILAQSNKEFDYVIVNDGSTDNTKQILDQVTDSRVKIIHLPKNEGSSKGLNLAVESAKGDWIAIQDADDISVPVRLEKQLNHIRLNPSLVAVGSKIKCIPGRNRDSVTDRMNGVNDYWNIQVFSPEQMKRVLLWGCPLCHGSVMFSKAAFKQVGMYDPSLKIAYDWDLWNRMFQVGSIEKVDEVLYYYRIHENSLSHQNWRDTCYEMMNISMRYILKTCYAGLAGKVRFIVVGSQRGARRFVESVRPQSSWEIKIFLHDHCLQNLAGAYRLYKNGEIDGILILEHPDQQLIVSQLEEMGLKLNQDIFMVQTGTY